MIITQVATTAAVASARIREEEISIGEEEMTQEQWELSVYPNPATDIVYIEPATSLVDSAAIFSVTGQQINCSLERNSISISHLAAGLYILNLTVDGESQKFKIIKQ